MEDWLRSSHIAGGNADYVEALYEEYLVAPNDVPAEWRDFFDRLPRVEGNIQPDVPHATVRAHFLELARQQRGASPETVADSLATEHERKQIRVVQLISAYRQRGHQKADIDPLGLMKREPVPDLDPAYHQLSAADYDTLFQTGVFYMGKEQATLGEIVEALDRTYCGSVGAEFMHITDTEQRVWIQQRMDSVRSAPEFSAETKKHLLERLSAAEGLEKYLGSRYPGTKRFGLEGGESLIPMVDEIIQRAGSSNAKEVVIGMAHRGRLNVLVNTLGKQPADLFDEFEGKAIYNTSGDVKYHQGFSSNVMTAGGEIHLAMSFNPSHLEIVSPVVEGSVRARQDRRNNHERDKVIPIVMHGDAAFAGQGVVMETLQMSQTRAYTTGGSVHIVINNQVGFTTSKPEDLRSTEYCTDVAKMVQAPIFHVNGDDPEAVLFVTQLAFDYRQEFKRDVVIDLVCYRRRGHNEADEPSGTQPLMYAEIKKHPSTREIYAKKLVEENILSAEQAQALEDNYREALEHGEHVVKSLVRKPNEELFVDWTPYLAHDWQVRSDTSYPIDKLQTLAHACNEVPAGFSLQRQVAKITEDRNKMAAGAMSGNWGFGEMLAYATLLEQGYPVRITGQDVGRGTFSHRHAVLHDQNTAETYTPLANLEERKADFVIHDSFLSELAVLGFEYGYATTSPKGLVIWEAQFGDFANGAQIVIDQFITSGEHKWGRLCGLTMLLPHGYEGQGPEHSSARLERFLQLSAEQNIQLCVPTTAAQIFHLLRRQAIRPLRRPLVVMSPKSLLRHKRAASQLEDFADGHFQNVISEIEDLDPAGVNRLVLCSGKVYYELNEMRAEHELKNVAIVRIEQLYPFPDAEMFKAIQNFSALESVVWCQEEPRNQGAWYLSQHRLRRVIDLLDENLPLDFVGRRASASPAAGYMALHLKEQHELLVQALGVEHASR
ncbi:MAG: 2-oxoglutarate dehydrogenase E1 component [Gammaproteobacteria bacterium]|nr:2-oxoglutarate dehydrogenase E1 component [Gammaproteobacteria bacterium]MBT8150349.1 2-oxoglutarate dehydrogenase E1 component [Gammaproteobacteria bacterium]NND38094.1 2-oxoglutarate dehydrogenase E1 component [Pseudomonadales bacterium]NNM11044.1 2-oxoglutarate dehydrogenase E1 component [Pseudomonadales bacterium]RZV57103.1 MAG: 2-oxoglutarate dehydrogenase E1 component [Pseudomonadales bacterium]